MQETQNYKLKKIDKETDKILDSIDYLNENFDDIDTELGKKVNSENGKVLSTNDYTTGDKNKVENIATDISIALSEAKKYTDEEIAKFDFIKIVDTLPETGLPNRFYFVPKTDTQTQDLFDEYAWINEAWEWITTKQIEVDLTNYVTKTYVDNSISNAITTAIGGAY